MRAFQALGSLLARPPQVSRLQIGANFNAVPGWTSTDITPHVVVARIPGAAHALLRLGKIDGDQYARHTSGVYKRIYFLDVSRRLPIPTNSVEVVFSSHVLEHLPYDTARDCLREIRRVLQPDGLIRISVPDLDLLIDRYSPDHADEFAERVFEARQQSAKDRHYWMYNYASLRELLEDIGFVSVSKREYLEGECPDLQVLDNRPEISLFVEARKAPAVGPAAQLADR